jgi:hypothetical protein
MGNLTQALGERFDASTIEPRDSFEPLPVGVYGVEIESTDVADTKSGNGKALKITYAVVDGQFAGRKLFENINISHSNPQAEQIGRKTLSSLCRAIDLNSPDDSDEFIGRRLRVRIKVRKQEGYDDRNEVIAHESIDGAAAAKPSAPAKPASAKAAPPWQKKAA